MYIDGEYWSTVSYSQTITSNYKTSYEKGTNFKLGRDMESQEKEAKKVSTIGMTIDNFRIYDSRMLNGLEVKELYDIESRKRF